MIQFFNLLTAFFNQEIELCIYIIEKLLILFNR